MRETIFENGLRVPAEVNALFDELLEPYATADATGVRGDVAPFLTRMRRPFTRSNAACISKRKASWNSLRASICR